METIEVCNMNHRASEPLNLTFDVRWKRREWGGWLLVEAKTGRTLGWIVRSDYKNPRSDWEMRIASEAFRGSGPDDQGDLLDKVPAYLYRGKPGEPLSCDPIGTARDRWQAAYLMLTHLVRHRAPAVGFGAHYEVIRWVSKYPVAVAA